MATTSTEARIAATSEALRPYGFVVQRAFAEGLRAYEPFALFPRPGGYLVGAEGSIEGERVEAYEYTYPPPGPEGPTLTSTVLVVAVHHRSIRGAAAFAPVEREWSALASLIDTALWVPPFTFFKVFQLLEAQRNPDRQIGEGDFDRLYEIRAASASAAREAIPPSLVRVTLGMAFRGAVEVRPGVLLYSVPGARFEADGIVPALGIGAAFLGAFTDRASHGYR